MEVQVSKPEQFDSTTFNEELYCEMVETKNVRNIESLDVYIYRYLCCISLRMYER